MKRVAFLGVKPHTGGTWVVFYNLRKGLVAHGIELRWVVSGRDFGGIEHDPEWEKEREWGEVVAPDEADDALCAHALKQHLETHYDGAVHNVLCDRVCTNIARYLAPDFPRILLVHNITAGTYAAALSIRDAIHGTIGVSQRIVDDLVAKHEFNRDLTFYVPNAVPVERFSVRQDQRKGSLRILVLSRIENQSKGVFLVPRILALLQKKNIQFQCTVAGDGVDLVELKKRCKGMSVDFVGRVKGEDVPALVEKHDVYLFPSYYEGFGISLVEAMAGGCVPLSSALKGVTDGIVDSGSNGFLVPVGDAREFARLLELLSGDNERLSAMGRAAHDKVLSSFSVETVARIFAEKWQLIFAQAPPRNLPELPLESWTYSAGIIQRVQSGLPEPLKAVLRKLRALLLRKN